MRIHFLIIRGEIKNINKKDAIDSMIKFPKNRFNGLQYLQRLSAIVGVKQNPQCQFMIFAKQADAIFASEYSILNFFQDEKSLMSVKRSLIIENQLSK